MPLALSPRMPARSLIFNSRLPFLHSGVPRHRALFLLFIKDLLFRCKISSESVIMVGFTSIFYTSDHRPSSSSLFSFLPDLTTFRYKELVSWIPQLHMLLSTLPSLRNQPCRANPYPLEAFQSPFTSSEVQVLANETPLPVFSAHHRCPLSDTGYFISHPMLR